MKALSTQFWKHSAKFPREVLVFRDGCSEGSFPSLVDTEISGIRKALADVWKEMHIGTNLLSVFEPPKLTYVVCVNQHNVQVVPVKGRCVRLVYFLAVAALTLFSNYLCAVLNSIPMFHPMFHQALVLMK